MLERQWEKQDTKNYIETSYSKGSKSLPPENKQAAQYEYSFHHVVHLDHLSSTNIRNKLLLTIID